MAFRAFRHKICFCHNNNKNNLSVLNLPYLEIHFFSLSFRLREIYMSVMLPVISMRMFKKITYTHCHILSLEGSKLFVKKQLLGSMGMPLLL